MKRLEQINKEELFALFNGKMSLLISRYLHNKLKKANLNISVEQWTVLASLWKKDKVSQQTLSNITYRDKTSTTRMIDNLEKSGLVVRVMDNTDRRSKLIYLTQKGMDIESEATRIIEETIEESLKQISDTEIETCRNVLNKILDNIN